jgi:hypothetical protein
MCRDGTASTYSRLDWRRLGLRLSRPLPPCLILVERESGIEPHLFEMTNHAGGVSTIG